MTRTAWRVLAACGLGLGLGCCGKRGVETAVVTPAVPPATNATVVVAPASNMLPAPEKNVLPESVAEIVGGTETVVKAPRTGYLVRQLYIENQDVKAGQTLFLVDPRSSHGDGDTGDKAEWVPVPAPVSGVAERARHGAGDWVSAQDELAAVAEIEDVKAELTVPDALARKFADDLGAPQLADAQGRRNIELLLPDGSVYPGRGMVSSVITQGNVNTMQIDFPNHDHVLRPGEYVRVRTACQ